VVVSLSSDSAPPAHASAGRGPASLGHGIGHVGRQIQVPTWHPGHDPGEQRRPHQPEGSHIRASSTGPLTCGLIERERIYTISNRTGPVTLEKRRRNAVGHKASMAMGGSPTMPWRRPYSRGEMDHPRIELKAALPEHTHTHANQNWGVGSRVFLCSRIAASRTAMTAIAVRTPMRQQCGPSALRHRSSRR
jgi:hypothetical protein